MTSALPRVLFLLPVFSGVPGGGTKIVYLYANSLVRDGYDVIICYPWWPTLAGGIRKAANKFLHTTYHWLRGWTRHCNWFPVDQRVRQRLVWSMAPRWLPHADLFFATGASTALPIARINIPDSHKFYLIQDFEIFAMPEDTLLDTYRLPLQKLVISSWLRTKVETAGSTTLLLPNGYDDTFQRICPPEQRTNASVAAMWGPGWRKDWPTTLNTLLRVRQSHPDLQATVFGTGPRPSDLPGWATYVRKPTSAQLNSIYNEAAIFIGTSIQEGWGLPVGEAMRCGTAVVCTDNGGYSEMAIPDKTTLVVPAGDANAMADAVCSLIDNPSERIRLANAGHAHIQNFTLEKSVRRLEAILDEVLPPSLRPVHE